MTNSRGRPRSTQAHQAIITAFIDAVRSQGYARVSIDGVARGAGVSRSTIYRWYNDKADIALEAAAQFAQALAGQTFTGHFRKDLNRFMEQTFATANDLAQLFTALMAEAQADKAFAARVWTRFSSVRRHTLTKILHSGTEPGGTGKVDTEVLLDMIFGAVWYRLMSGHAPLDKQFQKKLLSAIEILLEPAF
ncbi:TetR/AcrR family transcriptional regulator [Exilibacterium tricleocarpae]|uniref:TetR/AcrR family transcriptional regulator n=1 Tax=Exilibacterium tricleocarpae TaxID=2591008 RepID=UPI0015D3D269|nr:TetR/AcrR family transcriptional regulator [Exilibacterium tricleocarpae]